MASSGSIGSTGKRSAEGGADGEKRQKLSFGVKKPGVKTTGLQIKLNTKKPKVVQPTLKNNSVFNNDSDDEPEEMPPEAKMKMRNIGRDTPTSAGPNSFGKTKQGFCNSKMLFQKKLAETEDSLSDDNNRNSNKT